MSLSRTQMIYPAILSTAGAGILVCYALMIILLIFALTFSYPYESAQSPASTDFLPPIFIGVCGLVELFISLGLILDAGHHKRYGFLLTISFGVSSFVLIRFFPLPFQIVGPFLALAYTLATAQILVLSAGLWAIFGSRRPR